MVVEQTVVVTLEMLQVFQQSLQLVVDSEYTIHQELQDLEVLVAEQLNLVIVLEQEILPQQLQIKDSLADLFLVGIVLNTDQVVEEELRQLEVVEILVQQELGELVLSLMIIL